MPPASQVREASLLHVRACLTPLFGGSLAVYGREAADPVCAVGGAGRLLVSRRAETRLSTLNDIDTARLGA